MFRFETLSITPRLAFYLLFSILLYLYFTWLRDHSFSREPPFFSSRHPCVLPPSLDIDLYFTGWILGMGWCLTRLWMHLLTFCCSMPSFLPHDHYRKMYGSITFGFFTWPVATGCQESSPQAFLGALLGLKHGVEGILTSLLSVWNVYSVVMVVSESFQLSPSCPA